MRATSATREVVPMPGRVTLKSKPPATGAERLGDRLSRLRRERGISQAALGKRIGVRQRIVSCYENHLVRIPAETLLKIADVLKVSVYELLGRAPAQRTPKDRRLWKLVEKIEALPPRDQKVVFRTIDAVARTANGGAGR